MKKLWGLLFLMICFCLPVIAQETPVEKSQDQLEKEHWAEVINATESHAVGLFAVGEGLGFCSGVVIETTDTYSKVLTAKHCIGMEEELYVESYPAKTVFVSPSDDLALITTDPIMEKTPVVLADKNEPWFKIVFTIGYPDGEHRHIGVGYIMRVTRDWTWARMAVIPGCSGGGIYNEQGELVGILWGGMNMGNPEKPGLAIFEPISDVGTFLKQTGN